MKEVNINPEKPLVHLDTIPKQEAMPTEDWRRKTEAQFKNTWGSLALMISSPTLVLLNWIALEQYDGSLLSTIQAAITRGAPRFLLENLPQASFAAVFGYGAWLLFQGLLYTILPGPKAYGQLTPGGNRLEYVANGLLAWAITHILYITASYFNLLDPAIIARNWPGLLVCVNMYGLLLGLFVYIKGHFFPTHPEDRKFSGSWIFDFWAGIELNPRIGKSWDIKFFHNGRPGIVAWTLIDLSWAAYQYQEHGYVTDSIVIVCLLQAIYVLDFFWNEDWYCRTLDISHDHFGFMLSWGDSTFLPTFYTLQAQYLARYPTHLTRLQSTSILVLGLLGYYIFRSANHQRNWVRAHNGDVQLWGRKATFITCSYRTSDGKEHTSLILTSGWWGVARHVNYVADLMQAFAYCATCGFGNVLPWSYFFFMCCLLHHRIGRDDRRCQNKYGEKWQEYREVVKWKVIPGVY